MEIYKLYSLRPREIQEIYSRIGGKFSYRERVARDGTGSPFLYYLAGHPAIDELNDRAADELRINFEEFRDGLMVGISERTHPYILPLQTREIKAIRLTLTREVESPRNGSFYNWLFKKGFRGPAAQLFARPGEYQEARTELLIDTVEYPIYCWSIPAEFKRIRKFFEKSNFRHLLEAVVE